MWATKAVFCFVFEMQRTHLMFCVKPGPLLREKSDRPRFRPQTRT